MHSRSTRILRLAPCASVLAALALPPGALAQTPPAPIEFSRTSEVVDGRQVILIRAKPPAHAATVPGPATAPASPPPMPSAAALAEENRLAAKRQETFDLQATVYAFPGLSPISELRWTSGGREWLAYSNVNFGNLIGIAVIETADVVYAWPSAFVTDGDLSTFVRPPGLAFSGPEAECIVYASRAEWEANPEAFAAVDWLIQYYEDHRAELATACASREAEAARLAALPPSPPKPVLIRYYAPVPSAASASLSEGGAQ